MCFECDYMGDIKIEEPEEQFFTEAEYKRIFSLIKEMTPVDFNSVLTCADNCIDLKKKYPEWFSVRKIESILDCIPDRAGILMTYFAHELLADIPRDYMCFSGFFHRQKERNIYRLLQMKVEIDRTNQAVNPYFFSDEERNRLIEARDIYYLAGKEYERVKKS